MVVTRSGKKHDFREESAMEIDLDETYQVDTERVENDSDEEGPNGKFVNKKDIFVPMFRKSPKSVLYIFAELSYVFKKHDKFKDVKPEKWYALNHLLLGTSKEKERYQLKKNYLAQKGSKIVYRFMGNIKFTMDVSGLMEFFKNPAGDCMGILMKYLQKNIDLPHKVLAIICYAFFVQPPISLNHLATRHKMIYMISRMLAGNGELCRMTEFSELCKTINYDPERLFVFQGKQLFVTMDGKPEFSTEAIKEKFDEFLTENFLTTDHDDLKDIYLYGDFDDFDGFKKAAFVAIARKEYEPDIAIEFFDRKVVTAINMFFEKY